MTIAELIAQKKKAASAAVALPTLGAPPQMNPVEEAELDAAIDRIDPPRRRAIILSKRDERALSRTAGENIDMTPVGADKEVATWHEALNSFESSLCVMRDPREPDVVWLAVRPDREGLAPLLIHRLPWVLWDHPSSKQAPF